MSFASKYARAAAPDDYKRSAGGGSGMTAAEITRNAAIGTVRTCVAAAREGARVAFGSTDLLDTVPELATAFAGGSNIVGTQLGNGLVVGRKLIAQGLRLRPTRARSPRQFSASRDNAANALQYLSKVDDPGKFAIAEGFADLGELEELLETLPGHDDPGGPWEPLAKPPSAVRGVKASLAQRRRDEVAARRAEQDADRARCIEEEESRPLDPDVTWLLAQLELRDAAVTLTTTNSDDPNGA